MRRRGQSSTLPPVFQASVIWWVACVTSRMVMLCFRLHVSGSTLSGLHAVGQELLRASAFYVGDEVDSNKRMATRMAAGTGAAPGQAPPDLPSLLLDGRICYIGMPVCANPTYCIPSPWCASVKPADVSAEKYCRIHRYLKLQGRQSCWRWSQTVAGSFSLPG